MSATVAFRFARRGRSTVFSALRVRGITGGATVVVRCVGKRCPVRRFIKRRAAGTLSLRPFIHKRLRAGIVLLVRVTRAGFVGLALDVAIRARRAPRVTTGPAARRQPAAALLSDAHGHPAAAR